MHPPKYASVITDQAIDILLDYSIPEALLGKVQIGSRVIIPLNKSRGKGTVWQLKNTPSVTTNLKPLLEIVIEASVITKDLILLAEWMSLYYATPLHKVLKLLLPKHIKQHTKEQTEMIVTSLLPTEALQALVRQTEGQDRHAAQRTILSLLADMGGSSPLSILLKKSKTSKSPINTLVKQKLLSLQPAPKARIETLEADYFLSPPKKLSGEQQKALDTICEGLENNQFSPHLLHGVTGSGKTEIYLQAIELALSKDRGVIFLVPEIALATQTIERLKSRFEEKIAVLHHRLSDKEKKDSWQDIYSRKARIIVGARSAIFCPVPNLGLIVVDEEQEQAYKQSGESPYYHARDVAVMRAKLCQATVILGSATPSLESYQNAKLGKYHLSALLHRPDAASLPVVTIVDMKKESDKQKKNAIFSDPLLTAIKKRLSSGEQTLLLLNRRGYHTSLLCLQCSHTFKCPQCEALLTYHKQQHKLSCHLCGYEIPPPRSCPSCLNTTSLQFRGFGTEMVERSLGAIFPESRILRMDADTTTQKGSHETIFKKFRSGKADILVGTQMIAKGLHFPLVTLVGVLNADLTLSIPDFRASESLFQLITQVAGRAGRSDLPGEVFIQTYLPTQSTLLHASRQDYCAFFEEESETRKLFLYPPYTHFIKISFAGLEEQKTKALAEEARTFLTKQLPSSFEFFPVIAAGHAKIENYYRFQFLVKTNKILSASPVLFDLQTRFRKSTIRLCIDVDPSSTFF